MKKFTLTISFLLALLLNLSAQSSFAPVGTYWNYNYQGHSGGSAFKTIKVVSDTIINGLVNKKLVEYYDNYDYPPISFPNDNLPRKGSNDLGFFADKKRFCHLLS